MEWRLDLELRQWQAEAIATWISSNSRGVVEAATGTGKTTLACAAASLLHERFGDGLRVVIVVPTIALAKQWRAEFGSRLAIPQSRLGEQHSQEEVSWDPSKPVLVTVLNTASTRLAEVVSGWKREGHHVLLIVDECHRAGASSRARIFDAPFDSALGLSATPERADEGEQEHIYPNIGRKIFEYPLLQALDDGVLSELTALDIYVDFAPDEVRAWEQSAHDLSTSISALRRSHPDLDVGSARFFDELSRLAADGDSEAKRVVGVLAARRRLITDSEQRALAADAALSWIHQSKKRAIIFHETITSAERTLGFLNKVGSKVVLEHSGMAASDRAQAIDVFRGGRVDLLVTVRALDEGLDVPEAELALIVSGSRSHRQRIQRIGRILRQRDGKHARVITLLVRGTPEESVVGARDAERLGDHRVRHHRFMPGASFDELFAIDSTHRPDHGLFRRVNDRLTYRFLVSGRPSNDL